MAMHRTPTRAVRRSLFGRADPAQLQAECAAALRQELEASSRRWGFDFLNETPLQGGQFQWECVSGAKVPALYRSCMLSCRGQGALPRPEHGAGKENMPHTRKKNATHPVQESTPQKRLAPSLAPCQAPSQALKRKQTNITDFYQTKKRVVATPRKSGQ
ncbi:cyclin-dependent kinase inhibitor 1 isoform X2 [Amia ocellicauda]